MSRVNTIFLVRIELWQNVQVLIQDLDCPDQMIHRDCDCVDSENIKIIKSIK